MSYRLNMVGTDVEVFLKDKDGKPAPVCGLLGGTKEDPRKILQHLGDGFAVQEDNVMAEFNIPPAGGLDQWLSSLGEMEKYLTVFFEGRGNYTIHPEASMRFDPAQLQSEQAKTFGCDPDFNIWSMSRNEVDRDNPELETLRTAGGHIHVSFFVDDRPPTPAEIIPVVKMLDLFIGVPSIMFDKDATRRKIYGRAGAFRPKEYGLEYRVLSGKWFETPAYRHWVFESVVKAFRELRRAPEDLESLFERERERIQQTVNESSEEHLEHFFSTYNLVNPTRSAMRKSRPDGIYTWPDLGRTIRATAFDLGEETPTARGDPDLREALDRLGIANRQR